MRYTQMGSFGFPIITSMVKALIIVNLVCWFVFILVIQNFFLSDDTSIYRFFGLVPTLIQESFFLWQPLTYMFIHDRGVFHILFNLIILWMFGAELERLWGGRFFLIYYLVCGVGAAVIYLAILKVLVYFSVTNAILLLNVPVVGASGAIFSLLLAYGWVFKDRVIYLMMIIPMKARTFTFIICAFEILNILSSKLSGPVANLAHLGGIISGLLFLWFWKNWTPFFGNFKRNRFTKKLRIVKPNENKGVQWN